MIILIRGWILKDNSVRFCVSSHFLTAKISLPVMNGPNEKNATEKISEVTVVCKCLK